MKPRLGLLLLPAFGACAADGSDLSSTSQQVTSLCDQLRDTVGGLCPDIVEEPGGTIVVNRDLVDWVREGALDARSLDLPA